MTKIGHVPCKRVDSAWSKAGHCPGIVRALFFSLKLTILIRDPEAGPRAFDEVTKKTIPIDEILFPPLALLPRESHY